MLDPKFDPLALLEELAYEIVRLNKRQQKLEQFMQELAEQHVIIAEYLAEQQQELHEIKQSTKTDSRR